MGSFPSSTANSSQLNEADREEYRSRYPISDEKLTLLFDKYNSIKNENDFITINDFKRALRLEKEEDEKLLVFRAFYAFKKLNKNNNNFTFAVFINGLCNLKKEYSSDKVEFVFNMFAREGEDLIYKCDLRDILIYNIKHCNVEENQIENHVDEAIENLVDKAIEKIPFENDTISLDSFHELAEKYPSILSFVNFSDDIFDY